ncbi:bifunctional riboflavin kinase/FAD synthetase [Prevotella sp. HJM029]|uniref:bifunctional riboflavin kinase/FAD synthetase n=1 Tax=Prevotella sp. HJM029 TaxID=1433844 RepID=UPI00048A9724|nr:bifunctional riboflavin kinase/FAD synthetase [Prevotella sp. HJM029]
MDSILLHKDIVSDVPAIATIGFFDGVHLGHRFLLKQLALAAQERQLRSVAITFDQHPRRVLQHDYIPELLTTFDEKLQLLTKTGIDSVAILPFNATMAQLSAHDFMQQVLQKQLQVKTLLMGYDNHFGRKNNEHFNDYVRYGQDLGIEVLPTQPYIYKGIKISSSVIRSFLHEGEVALANECLGYPYTLTGKVGHGFQQGRTIGFPTANLIPASIEQLLPANGVYAVRVKCPDSTTWHDGMMNIGYRPTFDGTTKSIEVNIFNYANDLYDKPLSVAFYERIRAEKKFRNAPELAKQLTKDREMIINFFTNQPKYESI